MSKQSGHTAASKPRHTNTKLGISDLSGNTAVTVTDETDFFLKVHGLDMLKRFRAATRQADRVRGDVITRQANHLHNSLCELNPEGHQTAGVFGLTQPEQGIASKFSSAF